MAIYMHIILVYIILILVERIISILWMIIGVCFFFFLIGFMSAYFNSIDLKTKLLNDKCSIVAQFCKQAGIDKKLKRKICKSLKYRTKNYYFSLLEDNLIKENIPPLLKFKIATNINNKILPSIRFFKHFDKLLFGDIVYHLQPLHSSQFEIIYRRGDMANESNL